MAALEDAGRRLLGAGYEPRPVEAGLAVTFLDAAGVDEVSRLLADLDGTYLAVEGFDDGEEQVFATTVVAGRPFVPAGMSSRCVGFHVTAFRP